MNATAARPMPPHKEFEDIRLRWRLSRRWIGQLVGAGSTTVDNWASGNFSIPDPVMAMMRDLDKRLSGLSIPVPAEWRRAPYFSATAQEQDAPKGKSRPKRPALANRARAGAEAGGAHP